MWEVIHPRHTFTTAANNRAGTPPLLWHHHHNRNAHYDTTWSPKLPLILPLNYVATIILIELVLELQVCDDVNKTKTNQISSMKRTNTYIHIHTWSRAIIAVSILQNSIRRRQPLFSTGTTFLVGTLAPGCWRTRLTSPLVLPQEVGDHHCERATPAPATWYRVVECGVHWIHI